MDDVATHAGRTDELSQFAGSEVLVIDDDDDFRAIVAASLTRAGLTVVAVENARLGLEHAAQHAPALIVMDVWMPGQSGIQACSLFRAQRSTSEVPIILMSAQWRDEAQLFRAIDSGATDVLAKERVGVELLARVRSALMLASARTELTRKESELDELRQFLAICAGCKQVRNESGGWEDVEAYLRRVTERELTHGICPTCRVRLYPSFPADPPGRTDP